MGLLSNLISKIFSHAGTTAAVTGAAAAAPAATPPSTATAQPAAPPAAAPPTAAPAAPAKTVDVAAILDGLAAKNPEKLDWKKSIVDLMKLVGMDSSFKARKQLAQELNYTGDPNDSASMNVWLHKQVLIKISENGGKVPQELLD
jgi:3-oxoacyl-ACP reductase-like protein